MTVERQIDWEQKQAAHYNSIAAEYERHYSDAHSQRYRARFINGPMTAGIDLTGRDVLEAMCGSGQTTEFLLSRGARVTGLDISAEQIASFREQFPQSKAVCASILDSGLESESFDCVVVVGGLHHLPPRVQPAIDEIHRVLKPGGYFCFCEPHAGSVPDWFRRRWYRHDPLFEKNEEAIDLESLEEQNRARFEFVKTKHFGNVAYLLVYNSLIFRVSARFKAFYSPLLMPLESAIGAFQGKRLSCVVVCQWRKKADGRSQAGEQPS